VSEIIEHNSQYRTRVKTEDGKLYAHTIFNDDKSLEQNNKIRLSGMLDRAKLNLHDNEDVRGAISCPSSLQWSIFKKKHLDTYKLIMSKDESDRMKGMAQIEILEPSWVIYSRT